MSAATITKRADELKPGDILPVKDGRVVVISVLGADCGYVELIGCAAGESYSELMPRRQREPANTLITVEAPALSPAQQHAEEMLTYLRDVAINPPVPQIAKRDAELLLAKIDPPAPPTLEEALEIMSRVFRKGTSLDEHKETWDAGLALLDRARRAGVKV